MRPRLPRLQRLAGAAAARGFRRAWQRAAERLPSLGRAGRWMVELEEGRPSLVGGPLFGSTLADLTTPEPAKREAQHRTSRRRAPEEMPSVAPLLPASEIRTAQRTRRTQDADPVAVRNLPAEAPGGEIARWAGERNRPAASEPAQRRREPPADRPASPPDSPSITDLRRALTERSRRPLDVEGHARPAGQEKEIAGERRGRAMAPEIPQRRDIKDFGPTSASVPTSSATAPDVSPAAAVRRDSLSLSDPAGKVIDPWSTSLAGTKAPRELLERALESNRLSAEASEPSARDSASPLRSRGQDRISPSPELPPPSRDRSEAPTAGSLESRPAPFAPLASDPPDSPESPGHGAAPLGPFPDAPAPAAATASPPTAQQAFSLLGPYAAPSDPPRPDDLWELAAKIDRILTDEARRHGIDV